MKFLIDNCLPRRLARRLDREGPSLVRHLKDYRPPDVPDEEVKRLATEQGFVVLTKDTSFIPPRVW
jgi:predicted nuclease of predicted toxin-antitoxin system